LFQDLGIDEIESFVKQDIKDGLHEFDVLEQCIDAMKDIKQRANFEVYLKKFAQSMDVVLPHTSADPYKIPIKRFGLIYASVKERYKDGTLQISGVGNKVKKLVNEHLISLGINPMVPPVELFSDNFQKRMNEIKNPKAKASEMEHAIRKHCKVNLDKDPVFYGKLSEKLDKVIQKLQEDWKQQCLELDDIYQEAVDGRQEDDKGTGPFKDLIMEIGFAGDVAPAEDLEKIDKLTEDVYNLLQEKIGKVGFWKNKTAQKELDGEIGEMILFSGITQLLAENSRLSTEILSLAKARHNVIVK
jgi:type I restriction enzyme R subunit